jgi:hypothetical protein
MVTLPRSARLAAWGTAWLHREVSVDDVVRRVQGDDEPHDVADVPGSVHAVALAEALPLLHTAGATSFRVALPAPGDPSGLAGPPELTGDAVDAGEAVLTVGAPYALIPDVQAFGPPGDQGHVVTWRCRDAAPPPRGESLSEAQHALAQALLQAGDVLTDLDVAAWRPEVATLLADLRTGQTGEPLPRGFPPQAQTLAARSARLLAVVGFALDDDGGAVSAAAARSRRDALAPLERVARHALSAACNVLAT